MKDLKRYITKKNIKKYKRGVQLPIDYTDPTDIEFLAYCVFNSFEKLENYAENFSNYMSQEEMLVLSFQNFGYNVFEDYNIPYSFVRDLILQTLLPDYKFDDIEIYFDSYWDTQDNDYWNKNINDIMDFLEKYKIKKRPYINFLKDREALDSSSICCFVIISNYLKKIYQDNELRYLFTSAIDGDFESPTKYVCFYQIYHDGYGDEPQVNKAKFIRFVEAYKNKFKKKREYSHNYIYANELVILNSLEMCYGENSIISTLINSFFGTNTEVMF